MRLIEHIESQNGRRLAGNRGRAVRKRLCLGRVPVGVGVGLGLLGSGGALLGGGLALGGGRGLVDLGRRLLCHTVAAAGGLGGRLGLLLGAGGLLGLLRGGGGFGSRGVSVCVRHGSLGCWEKRAAVQIKCAPCDEVRDLFIRKRQNEK